MEAFYEKTIKIRDAVDPVPLWQEISARRFRRPSLRWTRTGERIVNHLYRWK